ncbi:MAG: NAD-dependent epimerase/dehydratase family protein [Candidatus Aminicenantes bacterium]|nr:NAD-dependent epimerase/dehydratase family protein [Candidatus Aminicenantes bacterium]
MKVLVTGAAGFIGSRLSRRLLDEGVDVWGVDCLTDYYPRWIKRRNLAPLLTDRRFKFIEADLNTLPLGRILSSVEAVYHLAAQAGVRASWGKSFASYLHHNIAATQRLLEAAKDRPLRKIVYASSSSVYGLTPDLPMTETSPLLPISPYGVTKLAAEQLGFLYHKNFGLPVVSLRFFTVYGPGQRPDMAFHKFFKAILEGREIPVFGDGTQTRDFTYIDDITSALVSAERNGPAGEIYNIGGGHREQLSSLFSCFGEITGRPVKTRRVERQKGDAPHTFASITKARRDLDYTPRTALRDGLEREWAYVRNLYEKRRRSAGSQGIHS